MNWFKKNWIRVATWGALPAVVTLTVLIKYYDHYSQAIMPVACIVIGLVSGIFVFLIISPLFKNYLLHEADKPGKLGLFVKVGTGRAVAIDRGGNFHSKIIGGEDTQVNANNGGLIGYLWMLYKQYIWNTVKLHVYVPFFTEPKTYDLPRYYVREDGGKKVYEVIDENSPRYYSNHVRIAPFTWYFEFSGAEIQTIPFTIKGSAQVRIDPEKIKEALYLTESWNVLLDQALASVTRSVVRGEVTVDMVIGTIKSELWAKDERQSVDLNEVVSVLIFERLMMYKFDGEKDTVDFAGSKLADLGIVIYKIDISDFEDELSPAERTRLRATILGRQEGRARDLTGQGIASEQSNILEVLKDHPDIGKAVLASRGLVDAAKEGSTDALVTALTKKLVG